MHVKLDVRNPIQTVNNEILYSGSGKNGTLDCNNYYYMNDGVPVFPVMGEIHPMRIDPEFWEDVIVKAKCGGLNTISFYVFWICIEPAPGVFDFTGRNNIRHFAELCVKHGLYAVPRIGPFCNAEMAHGGLPSWLYGMPVTERSNDPGYLTLVSRLYHAIAEQFKGLFWRDGGPIVCLQLENEYGHAPALWSSFYPFGGNELVSTGDGGDEHMLNLKRLAIEAGFDVPFWTATGWGDAPVPEGEFLGTGGAYTYLGRGGPTEGSCFNRIPKNYKTPYTTCELGTGVDVHSPWRPHVPPEGAEVVLLTSIAQGSNACGFYMYAGGSNPATRERFFVSDQKYLCMNLISYDFSAPIGEYGLVNDTYRHLRPWLTFLQDYTKEFVTTKPVWQEDAVLPEDTEHLRYMARVDGNSGYLFINNFQDKLTLPERNDVSIQLELPGGKLLIPQNGGITVAENEMLMLPFNMALGKAILNYAIVTPVCKLENGAEITHVFRKTRKNPAVYVFPRGTDINGNVNSYTDDVSVTVTAQPDDCFSVDGVKVLTLEEETVLHMQKVRLPDGNETLINSPDDFTYKDGVIRLTSFSNEIQVRILTNDGWKTLTRTVDTMESQADVKVLNGTWATVKLPENDFNELDDIFMELRFDGDIARVFADGKLVADHYNDGRPWQVSLKHLFREVTSGNGLAIRLLPKVDGETAMCFDGITYRPVGDNSGTMQFKSIEIKPHYKVFVTDAFI